MGLLNDIMVNDAAAFVDVDGFGESVTYLPKGGSPLTISAIINRNALQPRGSMPVERLQFDFDIEFAVADVATVNRGGDQVTFPREPGGTDMMTMTLSKQLADQHPGLHHYGLS